MALYRAIGKEKQPHDAVPLDDVFAEGHLHGPSTKKSNPHGLDGVGKENLILLKKSLPRTSTYNPR
jgi:hypothetical protein